MDQDVRPFTLDVPEAALDDLRRRLSATRWPEPATVDDWSQGVPLAFLRDLCGYWAGPYDWRRAEAELNGFGQWTTTVDGLELHFLHVRSPHPGALPLVLTHGWPGSVIEFHKVIGPLTDPPSHGGDAADAFHVVCPSLPGYGFSAKPARAGWGVGRIAAAWATLMARLGYHRYGAHGGDWGSAVTTALGRHDPDHLAGIHLTMPIAPPDPESLADLTAEEQASLASMLAYQEHDSGYSKQQSTRPQTVGYGLVDSPAGLCAWIVEKFWSWTDCDGDPLTVLTRDELLDDVMLYWLPGTGASSARLYWESFGQAFSGTAEPVAVPVGCSIFPKEIFRPSRRWAERAFPDLRHFATLERGGHFAAFEQPATFVDELRATFRTMR